MAFPFKPVLDKLEIKEIVGEIPELISGISQDSRRIERGYLFLARAGASNNALNFVDDAKQKGAVCVVTDLDAPKKCSLPLIRVVNIREALTVLSHYSFGDPSRRLKFIGVTGTDGKTSTVHIIQSILNATGEKCGMISTIGYDVGNKILPAPLTTPDIDYICYLLNRMEDCQWAVSEVSSHALDQGRINGVQVVAAGFTQLSSEHRDYHPTMGHYANSKAKLFKMLEATGFGVINIADSWSKVMLDACNGKVVTYGYPDSGADLIVTSREQTLRGSVFQIEFHNERFFVETSLVGGYQGENIALASGILLSNGISTDDVIQGVWNMKLVPGRMETVDAGQPFEVFVDYSHTARSLWNAINTLKPLTKGRMIVVFGCGGDRDVTKRPQMGKIAAEHAGLIIITSDNPRFEHPESIIEQIYQGVYRSYRSKTMRIVDRAEAIYTAMRKAEPGDTVLISGKGAEAVQKIAGKISDFDDRIVARQALKMVGWDKD